MGGRPPDRGEEREWVEDDLFFKRFVSVSK